MANPNWIDKWSFSDLESLVEKREVERKQWNAIAAELGKPVTSCHRRYDAIIRLREPAPSIVAETPRRLSLHQQLGIETYTHRQAILTDLIPLGRGKKSEQGWGYDSINRVWSNSHLFRASITLAKVFA